MIDKIEKLNKEIDRLMTEKTKSDAQKEVWENRLVESIKAYKNEYGVDLSGNSLADIKEKLSSEINIVETKTKEEFEKSSMLVNLINSGDIKGAWEVLGVNINEVKKEEVKQVEETKVESAKEVINELDNVEDEDFYGFDGKDNDGDMSDSTFNTEKSSVGINPINKFATFNFDDEEDEEDEFITPSTSTTSKENTMVLNDDEEEDEFVNNSNTPKGNTMILDDDDEDDDFGGFGNILSGSKFQV